MKKLKFPSAQNGRVFRSGLLSTGILIMVIVLAILVNLLVRALPAKYTEFDLSEGRLYTLNDSSVQLARGLEQDVTIYYLAQTGQEDAIIKKLLDHYAAESSHLHWEQKDPAIYPTFAAQYGAQEASAGSLIVVCGEQSVVLDAAELYEYDYSNYYTTGSYGVTFGGESKISAAIYRLTGGGQSHAYYTTNHGELAPTASLTEALDAQNIDLHPLDLLTSTIPEDCDLLLLLTPAEGLAGEGSLVDEAAMLKEYLERGGALLVTTDAYYETPVLDEILAEFGLTREQGLVVEGDADHALYGYPFYLLPDYASTEETTALDGVNRSAHVLLQMAQGIAMTQTEDILAEPLLETSTDAYSKLAGYGMTTADYEAGDTEGPFALAVWARSEASGAQIIWIGCGNLDSEQLYQQIPGNLTFLQSCAASLAGQNSGILIETKALEAAPITVAASAATALGLIFLLVLPAAVLVLGVVVGLLRRRK